MEKSNLFAGGFGEVNQGRVKRFDATTSKIFKKTAQSNEVVGLGKSGESAVGAFIFDAVESETVFTN